MSNTPTVFERMTAILAELPPIGKDQKNTQQNFMFRGHDDVLNALNPLLAKHGVFVLPHVLARETSQRSTSSGKAMFEVSLLVEYTFYGAAGDSVRGSAWGEGTDMGDKATSKAMTMAFKSVLNQAFAISNKEAEDPDRQTPEDSTGRSAGKNSGGAQKTGNAPAPAAEVSTDDLRAEYDTIAQTWSTLEPEFDLAAARREAGKKLAEAKKAKTARPYRTWLRQQIDSYQVLIRERTAQVAAEEKFPIPDSAKAA